MSGKKIFHLLLITCVSISVAFMTGCTPEYEVEVRADPEDAGEISGEDTYEEGEEVSLYAEIDQNYESKGYEFAGWEKDGEIVSEDEIYQVEVDEDIELTAQFEMREYEVSLNVNDEDMGGVSGSGTYHVGKEVMIEAEPKEMFEFNKWTDDEGEEISTDDVHEFRIDEDMNLTANFQPRVLENSGLNIKSLESNWNKFKDMSDYSFINIMDGGSNNLGDYILEQYLMYVKEKENKFVLYLFDLVSGETGEINTTDLEKTSGIRPESWWNVQPIEEKSKLLIYSHEELILYDLDELEIVESRKFEADYDIRSGERPIHGVKYSSDQGVFAIALDKSLNDSNTGSSENKSDWSVELMLLDEKFNKKEEIISIEGAGRGEAGVFFHDMYFVNEDNILLSESVHRMSEDRPNVFIIDINKNNIDKVFSAEGGGVNVQPSPDGNLFYAYQAEVYNGSSGESWARVYDYSGEKITEFEEYDQPFRYMWSPVSSELALGNGIWLEETNSLKQIDRTSTEFAWSPNSEWLFDGEKLWNQEEGVIDKIDTEEVKVLGLDNENQLWFKEADLK